VRESSCKPFAHQPVEAVEAFAQIARAPGLRNLEAASRWSNGRRSVLSTDREGGRCETEVVESGDELADVDDAAVTRVGLDGLLLAIDANTFEPLEVAADPRLPGDLHVFLDRQLAHVGATEVWEARLESHVRNAAELDVLSDEAGVAHGAVECYEVHPRDILGPEFNLNAVGEVVERPLALVTDLPRERVLLQLDLVRPDEWMKGRTQVVEATAAAQVVHPQCDSGVRAPGGVAEPLPLHAKQHGKGLEVFAVVDSEKRCRPYKGHGENIHRFAEREFHTFASQSQSVGVGEQLQHRKDDQDRQHHGRQNHTYQERDRATAAARLLVSHLKPRQLAGELVGKYQGE